MKARTGETKGLATTDDARERTEKAERVHDAWLERPEAQALRRGKGLTIWCRKL
jgi:hypothetical protein